MKDTLKSEGILFGLAIGDALGWPTEFMRLNSIKEEYGPAGISDLPDNPLFTDDTQMTLAIAEALLEAGGGNTEEIMKAIGEKFAEWRYSPENNRAPGNTCLYGTANLASGMHWKNSGDRNSMGCGSAMRVAAIGYLYQHDPDKLKDVAHASGICTHGHPGAVTASIAAAWLVTCGLDGKPYDSLVSSVRMICGDTSPDMTEALDRLEECLDWPDEEKALDYIGEGWVGPEAVALALYCFLKYPDDYVKTVLRGANTNGDSDSIACIAGSISGAYHGIEVIPEDWVRRIEKRSYLYHVAEQLTRKKEELYGK